MRAGTAFRLALREVLARRGRSLAVICGVAVCIGLYVALALLARGYDRLVRLPLAQLDVDLIVQRPGAAGQGPGQGGISLPPANRPLTPAEVERVRALPGMAALGRALILWQRSGQGFTVIMGFDPASGDPAATAIRGWIASGAAPAPAGEVLMEKHFARFHGLAVGKAVELGGKRFTISGLMEVKGPGVLSTANVFLPLAAAEELTGLADGGANILFARLAKGADGGALRARIGEIVPGATLTDADSLATMLSGFGIISDRFAAVIGGLALAFAGLVGYRLQAGSLGERLADLGIMKTVGWRVRDIALALGAESILLGLAGGALGLVLGHLAALLIGQVDIGLSLPFALNPLPAGAGAAKGAAQVAARLPVAFSPAVTAVALLAAAAVSLLAGLALASKAARISAMEAFRRL